MLSSLIGRWKAERTIHHLNGLDECLFRGVADITLESFEEVGKLTVGSMTVESRRFYRLQPSGEHCEIHFPDGRLFFAVKALLSQSVHHRCGDDLYEGRLKFKKSSWTEAWNVFGPRKHYRSVTVFTRAEL